MKFHDFFRFHGYTLVRSQPTVKYIVKLGSRHENLGGLFGPKVEKRQKSQFLRSLNFNVKFDPLPPPCPPQIFSDSERKFYPLSNKLHIERILGGVFLLTDLEHRLFKIEKNEKN